MNKEIISKIIELLQYYTEIDTEIDEKYSILDKITNKSVNIHFRTEENDDTACNKKNFCHDVFSIKNYFVISSEEIKKESSL